MNQIIFLIYRFIAAPISVLLVYLLSPLAGEKLKILVQRRHSTGWIFEKNPGKKLDNPFWIHAASGEIEYARPLIRELRKNFPNDPIIVTYSSPSAERILKSLTEVDAWGTVPWDLYFSCKKFIEKVNPRCVFFARTDVWPELITQISNRNIPSILFSATFAGNSSRLKGLGKFLNEYALQKLTKTFVVDSDDLKVLEDNNLNVAAEVTGDTRYDQVFYRLNHSQPIKSELAPKKSEKILVAGSTWPEDESVLLPWYLKHSNEIKLLLAPHEISMARLKQISAFFENNNVSYQFYSEAKSWDAQVLILDQIGILAELYTWGNWAFVGGSFKKQVHSVMEPLAAGLAVWVGPFHHNNREALTFKNISIGIPLVTEVRSVEAMETSWINQMESLNQATQNSIKDCLKSKTGATLQILEFLRRLPKTSL